MTFEEYKNLKVGDKVRLMKTLDECEVVEVNKFDLKIHWDGLDLSLNENCLDQFERVRKAHFCIPIEVTAIVYYDVDCDYEADSVEIANKFLEEAEEDTILSMASITDTEILYEHIEEEWI